MADESISSKDPRNTMAEKWADRGSKEGFLTQSEQNADKLMQGMAKETALAAVLEKQGMEEMRSGANPQKGEAMMEAAAKMNEGLATKTERLEKVFGKEAMTQSAERIGFDDKVAALTEDKGFNRSANAQFGNLFDKAKDKVAMVVDFVKGVTDHATEAFNQSRSDLQEGFNAKVADTKEFIKSDFRQTVENQQQRVETFNAARGNVQQVINSGVDKVKDGVILTAAVGVVAAESVTNAVKNDAQKTAERHQERVASFNDARGNVQDKINQNVDNVKDAVNRTRSSIQEGINKTAATIGDFLKKDLKQTVDNHQQRVDTFNASRSGIQENINNTVDTTKVNLADKLVNFSDKVREAAEGLRHSGAKTDVAAATSSIANPNLGKNTGAALG